jgi:predicted amidophosphoribosyltransferase
MPPTNPSFCKRCYANLDQATESRCARCRRAFNPHDPRTTLARPFPPPRRVLLHTVFTLIAATIVSAVIAVMLSVAQLKYLNSGH